MVLAALCFMAMNLIVRKVDHLPILEIVFFRGLGSLVLCWVALYRKGVSVVSRRPRWLIVRAVIGLSSMSLYYWAIQLMPLGTAVALRYLSPFFAVMLAMLFLRERVKPIQWLFLAGAFAGVLMVRGFDPRVTTVGLLVILTSAVLSGCVYFIIRKIGSGEDSIVIVHYFIALSTIVGAISCFWQWTSPVGYEWLLLLAFGVLGFVAQYAMTQAFSTPPLRSSHLSST